MKSKCAVIPLLALCSPVALVAAELELCETNQLPECHSIGWVKANVNVTGQSGWDGVLDEARWGTPSPQQRVSRDWGWKVTDERWRQAVREKGEGKRTPSFTFGCRTAARLSKAWL